MAQPTLSPILHTQTPLRDFAIHAIWRSLSTEQRMSLIALRSGRIGDVTLGDIERVRRWLPEPPRPGWTATPANDAQVRP